MNNDDGWDGNNLMKHIAAVRDATLDLAEHRFQIWDAESRCVVNAVLSLACAVIFSAALYLLGAP